MRRWISSIIIALICSLLFILLPDNNNTIFTKLNLIALIGTLITVFWYTIETNLMQEAIREQIDLSVMPVLAVGRGEWPGTIQLVNIGNGTACNIKINGIIIQNMEYAQVSLKFSEVVCLSKNECTEINVSAFNEFTNKPLESIAFSRMYMSRDYTGIMNFYDIKHRKYSQSFSLGKEGPKVGPVKFA